MSFDHAYNDVISVNLLHLSALVGPDCWNRPKPQPLDVSVYLYLENSSLTATGQSDDLSGSINYALLSNFIVDSVVGGSFTGVDHLIATLTEKAFALGEKAATEIRVVVNLPNQILLCPEFSVDFRTHKDDISTPRTRTTSVTNISVPVIIGLNAHEREAKQRVISDIVFHERPGNRPLLTYNTIIPKIIKNMESSSFLTLEKFVMEIVREACLSSEHIDSVTVRSKKPSALKMQGAAAVEITRRRVNFM